ncbi:MAG: ubiquitin-like small modifier protein 1, partial [Haloarculaceae archaeon]
MEIEVRAFATFRQALGQKTLVREFDDAETVGDVLAALSEEYPEMDLFEDGELREFVSILKEGREVTHLDGLETALEDGDTVSLFPPVAGG